jgi:hypothetical protein
MIKLSKEELEIISKKGMSENQLADFITKRYDRKSVVKEVLEAMYFPDSQKQTLDQFVEEATTKREQAQFPSKIG